MAKAHIGQPASYGCARFAGDAARNRDLPAKIGLLTREGRICYVVLMTNLPNYKVACLCVLVGCFITACGAASGDTQTTDTGTTGTDTDTGTETGVVGGMCAELPEASEIGWRDNGVFPGEGPDSASPVELSELAEAGWATSVNLLRTVEPGKNLALGPASLQVAMGMTYAISTPGSDCRAAIESAMNYPALDDAVHVRTSAMIDLTKGLKLDASDDEDPVEIDMVASVWTLESTPIPADQQTKLARYGAHNNTVSSVGTPLRELVNCYIEDASRGLLPDFLPQSSPNQQWSGYLLGVSYLKAPWLVGFDENATADAAFFGDAGQSTVPLMREELDARYAETAEFSLLDLPLRGQDLAVAFILPTQDLYPSLADFTDATAPQDYIDALDSAAMTRVDVSIPRFTIDAQTIGLIAGLGLEACMSDFGATSLGAIADVFHGASVSLDEKGVEAAAASAGETFITGTGPLPSEYIFRADRPFIFVIHEVSTNTPLYAGRFTG